MKLHKVRLVNLNSLYGEHVIDFANDLGNAPLFLILGQTGAGKSTILDAICLALFGQTPRLSKIPGKPETEPRLIMSHGTSECVAELEFSRLLPSGERHKYRATWTCRRSRGKADGNLQDPERSLTRLLDDEIEELLISDKRLKFYKPIFDEHLDHLTVNDFQRSVLLAQGEFAAFLRADESEKASILERLTNTDVYKRIGQRAAARRREVKRDLEQLEQRLNDLQLLEAHEEEELQSSFATLEEAIEALRTQLSDAQQAFQWLSVESGLIEAQATAKAQSQDAQAALERHADELQRLAEDQRCQPAALPLQQVQAATSQLAALESALAPLLDKERVARAAIEALALEESALISARDLANKTMEEALPLLEKAEGLQRIADLRLQELEKSESEHKAATKRCKEATKEYKSADKAFQALTERQAANQTAWDAIQYAAPLVEAYAGLASQRSHLDDLMERVVEAHSQSTALKQKRKSIKQKLTNRHKKLEATQSDLVPFEQRREQALATQRELLGDSPDLRTLRETTDERRQSLQERAHAFEDAIRDHNELAELLKDASKITQERAAMEWELQELRPKIELKQREYARIEKMMEAEEIAFRTIERTLALNDARRDLKATEPCPLCGSPEHPYIREHGVDSSEAHFAAERKHIESNLASQKAELKQRREELRVLDRDLTRFTTACQQHVEHLQEMARRQERLINEYRLACQLISPDDTSLLLQDDAFPTAPDDQRIALQTLKQRRVDAIAEITSLKDRITAIDDLRDELTESTQALEDARKESDQQKQEIHELEQLLIVRDEEIDAWQERLDSRAGKWQVECHAMIEEFITYQIDIPQQESLAATDTDSMQAAIAAFEAALLQAKTSKRAYEEAHQQREQLREQLHDATQHLERCASELARAEEQLASATEEWSSRKEQLEQARQELSTVLGKDSLEQKRAQYQEAIDAATQRYEQHQEALLAAREERSKQQALREEKQQSISVQQDQLKQLSAVLDALLASLELPDTTSLQAKLLSDNQRQTMQETLQVVQKAVEQSAFQLTVASDARKEHETKRPTHIPIEERDGAGWEGHAQELQIALEDQREAIGVLREKMNRHEEAKRLASEYANQLRETRESFRVWKSIDEIIGIGDGERFKQFAQSLNLQELVDRANARLLRLNPRYTLGVATGEQNEPRLDFVIKDRHHADHERPLTTLSGGETFLVSLALALALADFRRIDMPIETLLLDEGFGTLDQETLDIAMSTLRQLQQESDQQIGLISHVEMLKEMIDTRIIVEKVGNGRSKLIVEGALTHALPAQ